MLRSVDLNDYMQNNPPKVIDTADLFTAINKIVSKGVSGLCVVDADDNLVGVLSEIDCLRAIIDATYNKGNDVGIVSDHMTRNVQSCQLHENIVDVAKDMLLKGHRRRPVVHNGKLVGQITCRRLLKVVGEFNRPDLTPQRVHA